MSDEETPEIETDAASESAVAEEVDTPAKMTLGVEVTEIGPCKKHVRVQVARADIETQYNIAVKDVLSTAVVPGFRPGHVPRKLIEKRFRKEVEGQVKQKILMQSLEQVSEEQKLDAINEPDFDAESLTIPEEGDFTYEFDVEVRPEFDLPNYTGLKLTRPEREISDAEVDNYVQRYLRRFGELIEHDGAAEVDNVIVADLHSRHDGKVLGHAHHQQFRLSSRLNFRDAELADADKLLAGVKAGDVRTATVVVSKESPRVEMRSEQVELEIKVHQILRLKLPDMTEFLAQQGYESQEELSTAIRNLLQRQLTYEQRESARQQVLEKITESADWDLPESLVRRQVENALRRQVLEMEQAGFSEEEIEDRKNELLQQQLSMTRQGLKEHFILDKIAQQEEIEVHPADIEMELQNMAFQRGESPRKTRARLERMGLLDNLEAQLLEQKAVDVVLRKAEYVSVPSEALPPEDSQAVSFAVAGEETPAAIDAPADTE